MKQILSISNDPIQNMTVTLDDGSQVIMIMQYIQANKGWYFSLSYGSSFTVNMRRIVSSPNILRAYRNVINFGLSCVTTDKYEPLYLDDFSNGRASLFILNSDDVKYVESTVIPGYR